MPIELSTLLTIILSGTNAAQFFIIWKTRKSSVRKSDAEAQQQEILTVANLSDVYTKISEALKKDVEELIKKTERQAEQIEKQAKQIAGLTKTLTDYERKCKLCQK
ncbi:hypothetical protein [Flavobacterium sp. CAU 1735]|uniref:hypothetical protein n=1 Tax=Flavobacterium sp. CAU 1735 TaxID=3140361 RepID=UPI003260ABC9